ncbi:MAG: Ig-like domain-containing protein [Clostridiales bacterium]|nr:Ig-like domain-containing protein [Clostridiales bacterium]
MKYASKKLLSIYLSFMMIISMAAPAFTVAYAAGNTINITDLNGTDITERQTVKEYESVQLGYTTTEAVPDGGHVEWESNLPLLAGVDSSGKVTGYDYSKSAVINLWIDENIRVLPLVGNSLADSILNSLQNTGVDLDDMNNDLIVAIVRGIAGDTLADSLQTALNSMNVKITATLYNADGNKISSDTVEFVVEKNLVASVIATGAHITNRNIVPLEVAVGTTVQLYGAVTPVRLGHSVKWVMGSSILDLSSKNHASVSSDGLVTFTSAGEATIRVEDASNALISSTITFTIYDPADLPLESFDITGTTSVAEGETSQLAITNIVPAGAYTGDLKWESADTSIAVVDQNGNVTGLDGGSGLVTYSRTTQITATAGGVSKSIDYTVSRKVIGSSISAVEISGPDTIPNNSSTAYQADVKPDRLNTNSSVYREWGITDPLTGDIIWAYENNPAQTSLASISYDGVVTPNSSGIITIHARATMNDVVQEASKTISIGTPIESFFA